MSLLWVTDRGRESFENKIKFGGNAKGKNEKEKGLNLHDIFARITYVCTALQIVILHG